MKSEYQRIKYKFSINNFKPTLFQEPSLKDENIIPNFSFLSKEKSFCLHRFLIKFLFPFMKYLLKPIVIGFNINILVIKDKIPNAVAWKGVRNTLWPPPSANLSPTLFGDSKSNP